MTDLRLLIREFIKGTSKHKISEKLDELTPLLEDYALQMQLRNMTYQLLFENYSQRVAHPYGYTQFKEKLSPENRPTLDLFMAKTDGTLLKVINHIEKNALVIFDDFGLQPLDDNSRLALLQILEDCYERKSVIITSQLPIAKWYDYIKEPTLADAIMDRLTANARRIELKGQSLRRKSK